MGHQAIHEHCQETHSSMKPGRLSAHLSKLRVYSYAETFVECCSLYYEIQF